MSEEKSEVEAAREWLLEERRKVKAVEEALLEKRRKLKAVEEALLEERHKRKAGQEALLEERRKRKAGQDAWLEERRKRKDAEENTLNEERQREEDQCRDEENQRRYEEAQRQYQEDRRRRKAAEALLQKLTVQEYLEAYHSIDTSIEIITDRPLTAQEEATNPVDQIYPRRIIPWNSFSDRQEEVWDLLSSSPSFSSQALFPSLIQLSNDKLKISPVSNKGVLRRNQFFILETVVEYLTSQVYKDPLLRNRLGLQGTIEFGGPTSIGSTDTPLSSPMVHIPLVTGLSSDIQPACDVINRDGEGFEFTSKCLASAAITQLFSYMLSKGIRYGYICTGEAFVFLNIGDDPSSVYYSVCIPRLDFEEDCETRFHRTSVAQVFAFVLQAARSRPPSQAWRSASLNLDVWCMEYDDLLRKVPAAVRLQKRASPYEPQRWKRVRRFPIRSQSQCLSTESTTTSDDNISNGPGDISPSAEDHMSHRNDHSTAQGSSDSSQRLGGSETRQGYSENQQNIQNRPFCTHKCLHGLALDGPMDQECPNFLHHGSKHIDRQQLLDLVRDQLAVDIGDDADCIPLYISGARGSLFKVRLSSHGYTLVAKGVQKANVALLYHEKDIYDHIRDLQGRFVPVCLGMVDLIGPYYHDSGIFTHFLLMSYAGQPAFKHIREDKEGAISEIVPAFAALHKQQVLHRDAKLRNIVYDVRTGKYMIVDLERAKLNPCPSPRTIGSNIQPRRKQDPFAQELHSIQISLEMFS
ncbi:hypothetical protein CFIMG_002934RAa [Ceratocystis fimbriata CBS 114723]|uniref:Protein kinase domain-containing protein n=1 Tax=Ceratocystis fimbriata CBS 114723 TaxID=1035309 RepID=A0A2C5X3G4_9PEZI|nr:hypothetical protein CFIMG_002934RAa [Ceratocystis fimbriata CBS 114723]